MQSNDDPARMLKVERCKFPILALDVSHHPCLLQRISFSTSYVEHLFIDNWLHHLYICPGYVSNPSEGTPTTLR
jgi:hypothetical protein